MRESEASDECSRRLCCRRYAQRDDRSDLGSCGKRTASRQHPPVAYFHRGATAFCGARAEACGGGDRATYDTLARPASDDYAAERSLKHLAGDRHLDRSGVWVDAQPACGAGTVAEGGDTEAACHVSGARDDNPVASADRASMGAIGSHHSFSCRPQRGELGRREGGAARQNSNARAGQGGRGSGGRRGQRVPEWRR